MLSGSKKIDRRVFVRQSATAVGLGAVGSWGTLREVVLRSHASQKPVLTETSFNSYVQTVRSRGSTAQQAFVTSIRADVRAFVRNNFTLTTAQDRGLTAFTPTDVSTLVNAISSGVAGRNELRVRLLTPTASAGNCMVIAKRETKALADGGTADVWTVTAGPECGPYLGC
jgi:hypothetical protein